MTPCTAFSSEPLFWAYLWPSCSHFSTMSHRQGSCARQRMRPLIRCTRQGPGIGWGLLLAATVAIGLLARVLRM